jgi:hypothetical protein
MQDLRTTTAEVSERANGAERCRVTGRSHAYALLRTVDYRRRCIECDHVEDTTAGLDGPPHNCLKPAAHLDFWHDVPELGLLCCAWACLPTAHEIEKGKQHHGNEHTGHRSHHA